MPELLAGRDRSALARAPDPVPPDAPWLEPWQAAFHSAPALPLAQVATVSAAGEPEVRSVVVRGLTIDGGLVFTTDMRSAKADAVHAGSPVALCVWFAEQELQVRLRGPAALLASASGEWADVRRALWDEQRDAERRGVAGPPPGTRWTDAERPRAPAAPPASFGVAIVSPRRCELLRVGDPHVREVYAWSEADGWVGGRVVP